MRSNLHYLLTPYEAGRVKRYHTIDTVKEQTVADHTWGVLMIVRYLTGRPSWSLVEAALLHDVPEVVTGDVPAPAKWQSQQPCDALDEIESKVLDEMKAPMPALTSEEVLILKIADTTELLLKARREMDLGNKEFNNVSNRGLEHLFKLTNGTKFLNFAQRIAAHVKG